MELKNLSHHTQRAYLAAVTGIAKFYNQSPDKMTQEKIEDYLLYLKLDKGIAPNSCYYPSPTVSGEHRVSFPKSLPWRIFGRSSAPLKTSSTK